MSDGYQQYKVTIGGDALLLHNGALAIPTNPIVRAIKAITSDRNRKDTDEGRKELGDLEYKGSLYLDAKGRVILPSTVLEANIAAGAKKTKGGKDALRGMFVDTDGVLDYEGGPLSVDKLVASEDHRLTTTVVVPATRGRAQRVRPLFKNWKTSFKVSVLGSMVDATTLKTWITNAGSFNAIGDWRPRYGRYEVLEFGAVK